MVKSLRVFLSLFLSFGLLMVANGLFATLVSLRANLEGFSLQVIGFIMAFYFLGMFLGARFAPKVIQRGGHIRSFAAFASFMSLSPLAHVIFIDQWIWMFLRLIDGFCLAGLYIITESWLNARSDNKTRGGILAIYAIVSFLASAIGQLFLTFATPEKFESFAVASICFSLSVLPLMMTRTEAPVPQPISGFSIKPILQKAPLGFYGAACSGAINSAFFSLGPIYVQSLEYSVQQISIFMMVAIVSGIFLQIPLGKLSDRIERRKVLAMISFGSLVFSVLMVMQQHYQLSFYWMLVNIVAYCSLAFVIYPIAVAHANDWSDSDKLMETSSGLLIGYGCGAIFGPLISSNMMDSMGPSALFIFISANIALLMVYSIYKSMFAGSDREKLEFVLQPSVQFPTEELYSGFQDEMTPVADKTQAEEISEPVELDTIIDLDSEFIGIPERIEVPPEVEEEETDAVEQWAKDSRDQTVVPVEMSPEELVQAWEEDMVDSAEYSSDASSEEEAVDPQR